MSDNKILRLQLAERTEVEVSKKIEETTTTYSNMSNPIYKKMLAFHNSKIGDKLSIKDILR